MEELVVRILGVGDDGTLGVEAESHLIVLEAAVHGVDPGGAVGQHAGFPAGNSTACQVQPGDHGQHCHQCGNVQELLLQDMLFLKLLPSGKQGIRITLFIRLK